MHQNTETAIKIIKLVNGDDIVCTLPKEVLGEKSPLIRLDRPLQIKYVPQLTPAGFRDYIALIKWTSYSTDRIITIPKDKIMTITNASKNMISSYFNIVKDYDKDNLKTVDVSEKYTKQKLTDKENKKINEIFEDYGDFDDDDTTIH